MKLGTRNSKPETPCRPGGRAFTMVEMLVAMAITVGIILFINEVIGNVQQGVSAGLGLSNILEDARAIDDQIAKDAETMVPPGGNGVLVILNRTVSAKYGPADAAFNRRADQIMWIKSTSEIESVMPTGNTSYAGDSGTKQGYQKVWYGHAVQTTPAGLTAASDLGAAGTPDEFALNWHLARHGLFFDPEPSGANADGGWYNAPTTNFGGTDTAPAATNFIYMGITDVAEFGFIDPDPANGAMTGGLASAYTAGNSSKCLFTDDGGAAYASKAVEYLFVAEKLRVNPTPSANYESWKYAQLTPILAQRVIDFAIAFAGDYDGDGFVDVTAANGPIRWYGLGEATPPTGANGFGTAGSQPVSTAAGGGTAYVFRHGTGVTRWPELIRIRYRISDREGRIAGADGNLGRVFEQIIRVPR